MKEGIKEVTSATRCFQRMQRTVSEMLNTVDADGPQCPCVPLISVKNRKLRIQIAKEHHKWTIEGLKTGGKKHHIV